jgi:hypothetical protein
MRDELGRSGRPRWIGPVRDDECAADLEALHAVSRRGLPTMVETSKEYATRLERREERGAVMGFLRGMAGRPRLATALAGGAFALVFLFVPISYQRTVGHDVVFTLSGTGQDVPEMAKEMKAALHAEDLQVRVAVSGTETVQRCSARVPMRSKGEVERLAGSYAAKLAASGVGAAFTVTPVVEKHTGNVYLAAANAVIHIRVGDRSAEEIADDIRSQLADAGVAGAEVDVTREENCARICVRAPEGSSQDFPEVQCEEMDNPPEGAQCFKLELKRTPGMTDADLIAEVERQLREQGLSGTVTMDGNGCPKVEFDK